MKNLKVSSFDHHFYFKKKRQNMSTLQIQKMIDSVSVTDYFRLEKV